LKLVAAHDLPDDDGESEPNGHQPAKLLCDWSALEVGRLQRLVEFHDGRCQEVVAPLFGGSSPGGIRLASYLVAALVSKFMLV
jgi:hypothetical protein